MKVNQLPAVVKQMLPAAKTPVQYEDAVRALSSCRLIDEAVYWDNKADALAAWAKIYKDDRAGEEAKKLKLYAYRRMGELAGEMRPVARSRGRRKGLAPGCAKLLVEHGLTRHQAASARVLSKPSKKDFDSVIADAEQRRKLGMIPVVRSVLTKFPSERGPTRDSESYNTFARYMNMTTGLVKRNARELAAGILPGEIRKTRKKIIELVEWLDEFEQYLPKEKADAPRR